MLWMRRAGLPETLSMMCLMKAISSVKCGSMSNVSAAAKCRRSTRLGKRPLTYTKHGQVKGCGNEVRCGRAQATTTDTHTHTHTHTGAQDHTHTHTTATPTAPKQLKHTHLHHAPKHVVVIIPSKQDLARVQLEENTRHRPHVNCGRVAQAQNDLRRPVKAADQVRRGVVVDFVAVA